VRGDDGRVDVDHDLRRRRRPASRGSRARASGAQRVQQAGIGSDRGNAVTIARILAPHVAEVVVAHRKRLRAISHATIKTDRFDARVLAELLAAGPVPTVWVPDQPTSALPRVLARRSGVVKRRRRVQNEMQAVLHRNLIERPKVADLFGVQGRR